MDISAAANSILYHPKSPFAVHCTQSGPISLHDSEFATLHHQPTTASLPAESGGMPTSERASTAVPVEPDHMSVRQSQLPDDAANAALTQYADYTHFAGDTISGRGRAGCADGGSAAGHDGSGVSRWSVYYRTHIYGTDIYGTDIYAPDADAEHGAKSLSALHTAQPTAVALHIAQPIDALHDSTQSTAAALHIAQPLDTLHDSAQPTAVALHIA